MQTSKVSYILDAVRFSYKVFTQNDARKYGDPFFIDADTEFKQQIPLIGLISVCRRNLCIII